MPKSRLKMMPLAKSHVRYIMTWVNEQEIVKNLQHFSKRFTQKDEEEYVVRMLKSKNDYVFSFFNKKSQEYVGQGGIHQISWENKLGRLSLVIKREFWNQGYAQEILPALIKYSFKELGLHKIWLMHWRENKKADHLYKKLGFKKEALLKDEYFWQDKYHDMVRMSIINRSQ